jgi:predicted NACHT family NTPase
MVGSKIGDYLQKNYPFITTTRLVYFLLAILFLAFIYAIYEVIIAKEEKEPQTLDNIEPDVKLLFDSLKERYKKRYESKLDGRFEITLEVNKDWNFNQPPTFKVNYLEDTNIDEAFRTINEAFERQGRLLIVGSLGSGKTALLLKLAIELLGKDCKVDQKLPVIFNLASWSSSYAKFDDWLIDVLNAGNGLSKDFARKLLEQNHIIFLLDGLDELARNESVRFAIDKRAKCLYSLNDYLRMGRKAVICCRREEFDQMQTATNQAAPVSAKVEVLDLSNQQVLLYLQHAQQDTKSNASATNLLKIIETNDVFLDVLATPLYFTTALEVFDTELLKEKDFPTYKTRIEEYLFDRFYAMSNIPATPNNRVLSSRGKPTTNRISPKCSTNGNAAKCAKI